MAPKLRGNGEWALLSFLVSVSLIIYKRLFGLRRASPVALTAVPEPPPLPVSHDQRKMKSGTKCKKSSKACRHAAGEFPYRLTDPIY
jgi:hypothetical protein